MDEVWQEIVLEWPKRGKARYRWRGLWYCGWPREVEYWDNAFEWSRCPNVGVHRRIAEQILQEGLYEE